MKKRFKLIMSVVSLSLAFFVTLLGVYAAGQRSVAVTGTISFTSSLVRATVVVQKTNALQSEPTDANFTAVGTPFDFKPDVQTGPDYALGDTGLNDTNVIFAYRILITNNQLQGGEDGSSDIYIKFTLPTGLPSYLTLNTSFTGAGVTAVENQTNVYKVTRGSTITFTLTFTIDPANAPTRDAGIDIGCAVRLATTVAEVNA